MFAAQGSVLKSLMLSRVISRRQRTGELRSKVSVYKTHVVRSEHGPSSGHG